MTEQLGLNNVRISAASLAFGRACDTVGNRLAPAMPGCLNPMVGSASCG